MRVLVLNSGSSSLKFQVIATSAQQIAENRDELLAKGIIEKIGSSEALISCDGRRSSRPVRDHREAIATAFECLKQSGAVTHPEDIEGVGHRIVHGGERFTHSVLLDETAVHAIESCMDLAPLHNPHNLKGYYASRQFLPHAKHVGVFDTAFHHTLPPHAFLYGLPYIHYSRDRIRRYGFHGTSHRYVTYRYAQIHGKTRDAFKLISCHLGNGCSICAVDHGHSIDTSMGFTPLEGLLMGTRAGDIDPGVIVHLMAHGEYGIHEMETLLNRHSGLYGLSGVSNDMRDLLRERDKGHERARLAVDIFCYRIRKYIGAYLAAMNGADAILFTGGIGENAPAIRAQSTGSLDALGIVLDAERNNQALAKEARISMDSGKTAVWVIPTNEELLIARDTLRCIEGLPLP